MTTNNINSIRILICWHIYFSSHFLNGVALPWHNFKIKHSGLQIKRHSNWSARHSRGIWSKYSFKCSTSWMILMCRMPFLRGCKWWHGWSEWWRRNNIAGEYGKILSIPWVPIFVIVIRMIIPINIAWVAGLQRLPQLISHDVPNDVTRQISI